MNYRYELWHGQIRQENQLWWTKKTTFATKKLTCTIKIKLHLAKVGNFHHAWSTMTSCGQSFSHAHVRV